MNRDNRLEELKKLGNIHGYTLSSEDGFSKWQGRISALLSYDQIAKQKFDHYCDFILNDHEFGRGMISHETVEVQKKIHALIERVVADLEINSPYPPLTITENFSIPDPVVIPDAAGFGLPDIKITRGVESAKLSPEVQRLTGEEGLLWFWHHCHYTAKWKLVGMLIPAAGFLLWLGWVANEQEVFRDIGHAIKKFYDPPSQAPDEKADPKSIPVKP